MTGSVIGALVTVADFRFNGAVRVEGSMRFHVVFVAFALLAASPAMAQRSISTVDGARKIPVACVAMVTVPTISTATVACRRLDVPVSAANAAVDVVPAGMALAMRDARVYCDRCAGQQFVLSLYGQSAQTVTTPVYEMWGETAVDWHGAGPFLVVAAGSQLRVASVLPANRGDESLRLQAAGYLIRADQLGQ